MELIQYVLLVVVGLALSTVVTTSKLQDELPVAQTPRGKLIGKYDISRNGNRYETYLGIRYGHVAQRFDASIPTGHWEGSKNAHDFGPFCAQIPLVGESPVGSEDCLYLNVFTPKADNKQRAVFVYVHGGGFVMGSTLEYGGKYFSDEDMVVVTLTYRLGILGFMNTKDDAVSGNNGLKDQILALKWVQENIESFGGDRNRVTIGGNSAGSASVLHLLLSPMGYGLFHGVYAQSGSPLNPWAYHKTLKPVISEIAQKVNCETNNSYDLVECFRKLPVEKLLQGQQATMRWVFDIFRVGPSIEAESSKHEVLMSKCPEQTMREGSFPKVPVLITFAKDEGAMLFSLPILRNKFPLLTELNENRTKLDTIVFKLDSYPTLLSRKEGVSKRMRNFYFGGQIIQKDQEQQLTDVFSDTWFVRGIREAARLIGTHTPAYLGLFTYKRHDDYSPVAGLGVTDKTDFVTHCEELSYMFNPTGLPNPFPHIGQINDPKDIEISKQFVKLLADFSKTGIPRPLFNENTKWNPVSKSEIDTDNLNFMNIGEVPYLHLNPAVKRMQFWDELHDPNLVFKDEL